MFLTLSLALAMAAASAQPATAQPGVAAAPNSTTVCRFQTGPLAGQTRNFGGVAGFKPFAAGAPCTDGKDSVGVAVADRTGADASASSYSCRFTVGPRAGQAAQLQAPLDALRRPGSACDDGKGSRGIVR